MCSCVQSACDWEGSRQTSVLVAGTTDQPQLSKSQLVHLLGRLPRFQWGSKMQLRDRQRLYMKAVAVHLNMWLTNLHLDLRNFVVGMERHAILLDGNPLAYFYKFNNLRLTLVANGRRTEEIRSRINLERSIFSRLQSCLWSHCEISLLKKDRVYHA